MTPLSKKEVEGHLESLEGWSYNEDAIHTTLEFNDFKDAFSAMTRIAFEAEAQQHHPNWFNVYSTLEISLSTHDAGGVTEKDFKMAKTIESIVSEN